MTTVELIAKLAAWVRPLMTAYDSDLTLDLQQIANHPEIPFLHWTRKTGTDLALLYPANHPKWPAVGVKVQYLFGLCDRRELAHKPTEQALYWQRTEVELVVYFDGQRLRKITANQALDIAENYFLACIAADYAIAKTTGQ